MSLNWRDFTKEKPQDQQMCLCKMKHGMIEGYYEAGDDTFNGYYWTDINWSASEWVPSDEAK